MEEATLLTLSSAVAATLFGILSVVIGWMGARVIVKLEAMDEKLDQVNMELHNRINSLDNRLIRVEIMVGHK